MKTEIKKALLKIDEFCCKNEIEYMITGTVALNILGIFSNYVPHDIDVKVFNLKEEQKTKLKEYQALCGMENENYKNADGCYTFKIKDIKVNFLNCKEIEHSEIEKMRVYADIADANLNMSRSINIQKVNFALKDKMKLQRDKDRVYILRLIANLIEICDSQK